ncbi:CPBP family intramembrane metalloprotease [Patescibacteria group bacterium]|nr:CPBP family intramembrane metalloprotease [Patescibacteria group bacterium]
MNALLVLLSAASLPFITKIAVLFVGLQGYAFQSLYKILQLGIPIVWRKKEGHRGLSIIWPFNEPLPQKRTWIIATAIAIVLTTTAILIINLLAPILNLSPELIRAGMDQRFAVNPQSAVAVVIFLSFINSAIEELHFRAWLDREISKRIGSVSGILISAFAFGGMHGLIFYGMPFISPTTIFLIIIGLAVSGICWSLLARMKGGIHAAWWSHGLTDALLLLWGLRWLGYI